MFNLFTVTVSRDGKMSDDRPYAVKVDQTIEIIGGLQPNQLYCIPEAGWFGYALGTEPGEIVLYFKQSEALGGQGYYLAVTGEGKYRFGRSSCSPVNPTPFKAHPGQFGEGASHWGWLTDSGDDEQPSIKIPGFVREKLQAAA